MVQYRLQKFYIAWVAFIIFLPIMSAHAQRFGQNKVNYGSLDWYYIRTENFDIYHPHDDYELAEFTADVAEEALQEIQRHWNYTLTSRIIIVVYPNHNQFQNTNVSSGTQGESTGGFTEFLKNRVVVPFEGSYENFRHVIHHELTHAVMLRMLYGEGVQSIISGISRLPLPMWFIEGLAEYESRGGWSNEADMYMRDAVVNDYLPPIQGLGGYFYYKGGQSILSFIADRYGNQKVGEFLRTIRSTRDINRAVRQSTGMDMEELSQRWHQHVKREIWPASVDFEAPEDFAERLTDHEEWFNFVNTSPALSPDGDQLVFLSDRSDYVSIYLLNTVTGEIEERLVNGGRLYLFEKLLWLRPWLDWSPDSREIVFVGEANGEDILYTLDIETNEITREYAFGMDAIASPVWSPDGSRIAFSGQLDGRTDLFILELDGDGEPVPVTNDIFSDYDPGWSPDGQQILFISDRGDILEAADSTFEIWDHNYTQIDVYSIDVSTGVMQRLTNDIYEDRTPRWTPRGNIISFVSDRTGAYNLYMMDLDSEDTWAVTDVLTGVFTPSWADNETVAFASFFNAGYDIYHYKNPFAPNRRVEPQLTGFQQRERNSDNDLETATAEVDVERPQRLLPEFFSSEDDSTVIVDEPASTEESVIIVSQPATETAVVTSGTITSEEIEETPEETDTDSTETEIVSGGVRLIPDPYPAMDEEREDNPYSNYIFYPPGMRENEMQRSAKQRRREEREGPLVDEDGDYIAQRYRIHFTPDVVNAAAGYSTFFGLQGVGQMMFSDVLGNHVIFLTTDMYYSFENSNFGLFYYNLPNRTDMGGGIFHNVYFFDYGHIRDRNYGGSFVLQYPFSRNRRFEFSTAFVNVDRDIWDWDKYDYVSYQQRHFILPSIAYVYDNTVWGWTGPVNGRRWRLGFSYSPKLDNSDISSDTRAWGIDFRTLSLDARQYFHVANDYSFAFRLAGAASWGENPERFFLGGVSNWINRRFVGGTVRHNIDEIYFSSFALPLRGVDYYQREGTRYMMVNNEFRFPLVRQLLFGWPLPLFFYNVRGAVFLDAGAAWTGNDFRWTQINEDGRREFANMDIGFGWGARVNLGYFLLKWDIAWGNDYTGWTKPKYYVSIGTDL